MLGHDLSMRNRAVCRRGARETILNHKSQLLPETAIETARGLIQTAEKRL